jgi:hypothetical protein
MRQPADLGAAWTEFQGVELVDARLEQRLLSLVECLAKDPGASFPESLGSGAALEGAYRFFRNERVVFEDILEPHRQRALERVEKESLVLAVHDSSEFRFAGQKHRDGLGHLNRSGQGFLGHFSLLVSADGSRRPLGVAAIDAIAAEQTTEPRSRAERALDENRQSTRWLRQARCVSELVGDRAKVIHVEDREGDIYANLAGLLSDGERFVIRVAQDRSLDKGKRLFQRLRRLNASLQRTVDLPERGKRRSSTDAKRHPPRAKRTAVLHIAAAKLQLKRPRKTCKEGPDFIDAHFVRVFEPNPPRGDVPVEWMLVTTEPIETESQLNFIVDTYRARWVVEEYFKVLKAGCAYESRQLESLHGLLNALAIFAVLAWRLLLLKQLERTTNAQPLEEVTPAQIEVLKAKKYLAAKRDVTTGDVLSAIARLGGHLKNNGEPGWLVLWRGYRKLLLLEEGWSLVPRKPRSDQS